MKRLLVALLALAFAAPIQAPRDDAGAYDAAHRSASIAGLPSPDSPESARLDDARHTEVVARDSRAPQRGVRTVDRSAPPELANAASAAMVAHARTTGLAAAPHAVRRLAIPFDATAPPVGQLT